MILFNWQSSGVDSVNGAASVAEALVGRQIEGTDWLLAELVDRVDDGSSFLFGIGSGVTVELLLFHRENVTQEKLVKSRSFQHVGIELATASRLFNAPRHGGTAFTRQHGRMRLHLAWLLLSIGAAVVGSFGTFRGFATNALH